MLRLPFVAPPAACSSRAGFGPLPAALLGAALIWAPTALAQSQPAEPGSIATMDAPYFITWIEGVIREAPDSLSPAVAILRFGDRVTVTGRLADSPWLRVETPGGGVGYIWEEIAAPARVAVPGGPDAPGLTPEAPDAPPVFGPTADNHFGAANPITAIGPEPQSFQGMVGPQDEIDYYTFTLEEWTELHITLDGLSSDADISLLDGDRILAESIAPVDYPEEIRYTAGPGVYYIEVYIYDGETEYRMSVSGEPVAPPPEDTVGNTPDEATDLGTVTTNGVVFSDWVGPGDPVDYWRFTLDAPASVRISLTGLEDDIDIVLEDDFGSILNGSAAPATGDEMIEAELEAGTYFLRVYPYTGASPYQGAIVATPVGSQNGGEDGAGNQASDARDLGVIGPERITLQDFVGPEDVTDYFRFTVEETTLAVIEMTPSAADADLELLAAEDETMIASSIRPGVNADRVEALLEPGDYLARVYIFAGETPYRLEAFAHE